MCRWVLTIETVEIIIYGNFHETDRVAKNEKIFFSSIAPPKKFFFIFSKDSPKGYLHYAQKKFLGWGLFDALRATFYFQNRSPGKW